MRGNSAGKYIAAAFSGAAMIAAAPAQASLFSGDTLDLVANILAWIVLFAAPAIAIAVFWIVHILPEKIAEKRHHPQAAAIKTLCLLSLFFGGLLWPLAWLWAYSKPVLYKMAYGVDAVKPEHERDAASSDINAPPPNEPQEQEQPPRAPQASARAGLSKPRPWES